MTLASTPFSPEKETDKGAVKSIRTFLERAGITPQL